MKKKLKNNNYLIPSFLVGVTGLGFGEKIGSNNAPSVNISNGNLSRNKRNTEFSKNEEIRNYSAFGRYSRLRTEQENRLGRGQT